MQFKPTNPNLKSGPKNGETPPIHEIDLIGVQTNYSLERSGDSAAKPCHPARNRQVAQEQQLLMEET